MGKRGPKPRSAEERFWEKVNKDSDVGCWIWMGAKAGSGYGYFSLPALGGQKARNVYAHRFSWELVNRRLSPNDHVCHDCPAGDNPACVNPDHLFLGNPLVNNHDKWRKGRGTRHRRVLTQEQATEIRSRYLGGTDTCSTIATAYGISVRTVSNIVKGTIYRDLVIPWIPPVDRPVPKRLRRRGVNRSQVLRPVGDLNAHAKLSKGNVLEIVRRRRLGEAVVEIARDYPSVTLGQIYAILAGKSWSTVTGISPCCLS